MTKHFKTGGRENELTGRNVPEKGRLWVKPTLIRPKGGREMRGLSDIKYMNLSDEDKARIDEGMYTRAQERKAFNDAYEALTWFQRVYVRALLTLSGKSEQLDRTWG